MTRYFTHNSVSRKYILYIPSTYDTTKLPLVFNFHGYGGTAEGQLKTADMRSLAEDEGFILIYPQGTLLNGFSHWNAGLDNANNKSATDDLGFIESLINDLLDSYAIDSKRIYASGYSNGAFFSYALACYKSDLIAAVASVAGTMMTETQSNCSPSHPTPVLSIHGTNDSTVPYSGGSVGLQSIQQSISYWKQYNQTNSDALIIKNTDDTVEYHVFSNGTNAVSVEHYKVISGEHIWDDKLDFNGANTSTLIWTFFNKYDKTGDRSQ